VNGPTIAPHEEEETRAELSAFGASETQIQQYLEKERASQVYEVLEENWQALGWFLDVDDLFVTSNGWIRGLDIVAIKADAELSQRTYTTEDYEKLRILGRAAAHELNNKNNK
jgi:hypothetical protein